MVSGLFVLGILVIYGIYWMVVKLTPPVPPIRDYERFNKESITMSKKELRKAMKEGRWS